MREDLMTIEADAREGDALIQPLMTAGGRLVPPPGLAEIRARAFAAISPAARAAEKPGYGGGPIPVSRLRCAAALAAEADRLRGRALNHHLRRVLWCSLLATIDLYQRQEETP